MQASSVATAIL